jgi:hypothetical protein
MTQQGGRNPNPPAVRDPDSVPETLCEGPVNIHLIGQLATITFTHLRPNPLSLFAATSAVVPEQIVRARVTMSLPNVVALRDLLNRVVKDDPTQVPTGSASTDKLH